MEPGIKPMEVNEYVITKDGEIAQIKEINGNSLRTDMGIIKEADVVEHNLNLNMLAKNGDFINGARVYESGPSKSLCLNGNSIYSVNILQMMTKKKFFRECYSPKGDIVKETWKTIEGFPKYEVSDYGIVRSKETGRYMSILQDRETLSVRLESNDGRRLRKSIAVLVLEAFDSDSNGRLPKFINGDNQDCRLSNLEWESRSDQAKRVLPIRKQTNRTYKYTNLIGYIQNKPVIYADNSRDLKDTLQMNSSEFSKLSLNHLARSVSNGIPYKGVLFKQVSDYMYNKLKLDINNKEFDSYYNEFLRNKPLMVGARSKPKEITKKVEEKPKKLETKVTTKDVKPKAMKKLEDSKQKHQSSSLLDDLTYDDFLKDMEIEKRNKFKEELLKRLRK